MIVEYKAEGYYNSVHRQKLSIVMCDDCKETRKVRRERTLLNPDNQHICKHCAARRRGLSLRGTTNANKGKASPFKGKTRGPYKQPGTTSYIDSYGYRQVWCGKFEGSRGRKDGYRAEHHLVAEDTIGRKLRDGEIVHHIDGDKLNNAPDNLVVFESQSAHRKAHAQLESLSMSLVKAGAIKWDGKQYFLSEKTE
mgnify:FL=1